MKNLSLLIKPASSACNMSCSYCFYHDVAAARNTRSYGLMRPETLEHVVREALECAQSECTFAFQGGEPMLAGLPFFRHLIEIEKTFNKNSLRIHHALQTNAVLMDPEWASFLKDNDFLVGVSLDGPRDIHDQSRCYPHGGGSFAEVMNGIDMLRARGVQFNILAVVTGAAAKRAGEVYGFFRQHGFSHVQFIPCLDSLSSGTSSGVARLAPDEYETFLKVTFDAWFNDLLGHRYMSIRYFDNLVRMFRGQSPEQCSMGGQCQCQVVVEADGSVFPCDFYANDEWKLGNLVEDGLRAVAASPRTLQFVESSVLRNEACRQCKWLGVCRNGCRRDRDQAGSNVYCSAFFGFLEYAGPRLNYLARTL